MENVNGRSGDLDFDKLLATPQSDAFVFGDKEQQILDLWNLEKELRLEAGLLEAQGRRRSHITAELVPVTK
jgi:hypothetical protein